MAPGNHLDHTVRGYDLCDIRIRQAYEQRLSSLITPAYKVDISFRYDDSDPWACFYQNGRINLYIPLNRSLTLNQMVDAIHSAFKSDPPSLIDLITGMEDDPAELERIKKRLNIN